MVAALSPGRDLETFASQVAASVASSQDCVVDTQHPVDASRLPAAAIEELCNALSLRPPEPLKAADLVLLNPDRFLLPRLVIIPVCGSVDGVDLDAATAELSDFAHATKDLGGPVGFLVILGAGLGVPAAWRGEVAPPATAAPLPLPFWRSDRPLVDAGYDTSLSLRVYWEAAGQEQAAARLAPVRHQAAGWVGLDDSDRRLDQAFDAVHALHGTEGANIGRIFSRAFSGETARKVLATGCVDKSLFALADLVSNGVAWCPPGGLRALVAPFAAFCLTQGPNLVAASLWRDSTPMDFRRSVRRNHLLANWALQLTSCVERELVNICKADPRIEDRMDSLGLSEKLVAERAKKSSSLAYDPETALVEFASFGDLVQLVSTAGPTLGVPVSVRRLDSVRLVRNLAAHLHPVSWLGIRTVLEAIEDLHEAAASDRILSGVGSS